jgi:uncharacterized peroxidase-related enzyme
MLRLSPVEPNQVRPELLGMLDESRAGSGPAPDFLKILAQSRAASLAFLRVEETLAKGRLSVRQREQIALAVAEINGCKYCLRAHSVMGRKAGLTEQEIESARRAAAPEAKADQMLRFTQSLVLQRGEISDADLGALRKAGFAEADVVEIVANIALNVFTNYLNILSKTEADHPAMAGGRSNGLPGQSAPVPA